VRKVWAFFKVVAAAYIWMFSPTLFAADTHIEVNTFQLPNGLKVILAPMDNVEATCVMLYHLTGVRDDPIDIKGASYLYQVLVLSGTQNLEPQDRTFFVKRRGGAIDNNIDYDNSIFCQIVPGSELNNALWLESERIGSLKLEDRYINGAKEYNYRIFSRLINSNIHFRASTWVRSKVFEGTVYETPIYGNLDKLTGFSNRKIKQIYDNFKNLSDIVMVISGKLNMGEVKAAVSKHFAHIASSGKPRKRNYTFYKPRTEYVYKNWVDMPIDRHFFIYGIRGPSKRSPDNAEFDFLRYYLVDKRISRLDRMLNQRNDLDVSISYEYTDFIEANALLIKVSATSRFYLEKAKYVVSKEFASLMGKPISNSDVKVVKTLMEIDFKKDMRDLKKRGYLLARHFHLNGNLALVEQYLPEIRKINGYDIVNVAKKYLQKENLVVLNVYRKE